MPEKKKILILCTGNSARSQMAEGLLKHITNNTYEVYSAGTKPSIVRPEAIKVLAEIGIDIAKLRLDTQRFTVGISRQEAGNIAEHP